MKYGVNNASRVWCKTHGQAHPSTETCPWCVVKPWASTLENVPPPDAPESECVDAILRAIYQTGWITP